MDASLRLLSKLHTRAAFRRVRRSLRTPKGAVFAIVGALVMVMWFAPVIFTATKVPRTNPEHVRLFAPLVILLMCVVTLFGGAGDRVISFTPGEVNFLFPGPFTRRQLLLYKLKKTVTGGIFAGVILSLALLQHASHWGAAAVGAILAILFVQFVTLALVMAAQAVGARAYSRGRRIALAIVVAAAAIAVAPGLRQIVSEGAGGDIAAMAAAIRHSTAARVLLSPFIPFVQTFTAQSLPALVLWGSISALIDIALFGLILRLDADYRDVALAASQRMADRLQRLRGGKMVPQARGSRSNSRWNRVPMLPWLRGAGPTIWRQLVSARRTSRAVLLIFALMGAGILPMLFTSKAGVAPVVVTAIWGTMLLTMVLKFDFRAELDQLEWLKAMPLPPTATAIGQLAVPVLMVTTAQAILLGTAAFMAEQHNQRMIVLAILPFLLPFNLLMLSVENLLFLLFPSRPAGASPGDIGLMGRQIVFFLLKMLMVFFASAVAVGFGMAAMMLANHSFAISGGIRGLAIGAGVAFVVLLAISFSMVPCVGWAFRRFDPSSDTPP